MGPAKLVPPWGQDERAAVGVGVWSWKDTWEVLSAGGWWRSQTEHFHLLDCRRLWCEAGHTLGEREIAPEKVSQTLSMKKTCIASSAGPHCLQLGGFVENDSKKDVLR